jgi:hypothetical protein
LKRAHNVDDLDKTQEDDGEEVVELHALTIGQKVTLRDGENVIFAYAFVADPEPSMPDEEEYPADAAVGDYILVHGTGSKNAGAGPGKSMKIVDTWENYILFEKVAKNKQSTLSYSEWPGVMLSDYTFFGKGMSPGELSKKDVFLIKRGHVSTDMGKKNKSKKHKS